MSITVPTNQPQPVTTTSTGTYPIWPTVAHFPYPINTTQMLPTLYPIGEHHILINGTFEIHSGGLTYRLSDALSSCKNIKYLKVNDEIILPKLVWEALLLYISCEDGYASLTPSQFLDKMFPD